MYDETNAPPARLTIAIIGGGIGGIALAISLARIDDLEVRLFEAADAFSEIGAGISFGPNAVTAIRGLGLEPAYRRVADGSPAPYEDVWFEWRRARDNTYLTSSLAPGCGQSSVHRADFLDVMLECLPDGIAHFGKRCCGVCQADSRTEAVFEDGSRFKADVIIGADGINSSVRGHVLPPETYPHNAPRYCGTQAYRGLIDREALADRLQAAAVEPRLAAVPQMYLGIDRHVLTFPVKQGEIVNVVAFVTDRSQPRPTAALTESWVSEVSARRMQQDFASCGPAVHAVLEGIDAPTCWSLHDLPVLPRYHRGRVVLMGDGAHATLPHQGAGAGQALEDAYVLARLLGDSRCENARAADVLAAFDGVRRARAAQVQTTSFEAGELYQCRMPGIADDESPLAGELEQRFDWIWNFDPERSVGQARTMMGWLEDSDRHDDGATRT